MIKILNAESREYSSEASRVLSEIGEVSKLDITRDELLRIISTFDVLITRLRFQIDEEIISEGKKLIAIVTATTGLDHIDVNYAQKKGIVVISLNGEYEFLKGIHATAEHTWALLLSLIRRIPEANNSVLQGHWNRYDFFGTELHSKKLGILGFGRIGQKIYTYAIAFGMKVNVYDPFVKPSEDQCKYFEKLDDFLSSSEILSIHLPLNKITNNLIGERELSLLPKGATIINTSRAQILNSNDLVVSLKNGHIRGAAVDVVDDERDDHARIKNPLINYAETNSNVIITPHIGGASVESMQKTEIFIANKLRNFLMNRIQLKK